MTRRRPSLRQQQIAALKAKVDAFNAAHPVGARVVVSAHNQGESVQTRSAAFIVNDHSAAIYVVGTPYSFPLDRVTAVAGDDA